MPSSWKRSLLTSSINGTKDLLAQGWFQNTVCCVFHSQHLLLLWDCPPLGLRPLFLQKERGIQLRIKKSVFSSGFQHRTCERAQKKQESIRNEDQKVFGVVFFFFFFKFQKLPFKYQDSETCIFRVYKVRYARYAIWAGPLHWEAWEWLVGLEEMLRGRQALVSISKRPLAWPPGGEAQRRE